MIRYRIPPGVEPVYSNKQILLSTQAGGRVMVDRMVLELWQAAGDRGLDEILAGFGSILSRRLQARASLACLAEAGLLERQDQETEPFESGGASKGRISVVIVSYNSRGWLGDCLESLQTQTLATYEVIIVDNGSQDGSADWIALRHPEIQLVRLEKAGSLAGALNAGLRCASGEFFLLLNPDVKLAPWALAQMAQVAQCQPGCAAVAAKLRLLWTPRFLNGLGNLVGPFSWGADIGLGHLDLGQLDGCAELPSACFAAALLPAWAIEQVGPLDEQFPLYYEDSEWCYRARLYGFTIRAAPKALVYHAFSGRPASASSESLSPARLRRVVFGRLNFITKINGAGFFLRFMTNYCLEDLARLLLALVRGRWGFARALIQGWQDYWKALPDLKKRRREIQSRRLLSDRALYRLQRAAPAPFMRQALPLLTWDNIYAHYFQLILAGKTRQLPEFAGLPPEELAAALKIARPSLLERARRILSIEGPGALLYWLSKGVQWWLVRL